MKIPYIALLAAVLSECIHLEQWMISILRSDFEENLWRNRPHSQMRGDQDEMWRPLFWWHPSNTFSKKTSEAPWTFFKNIKNHLKHHEPFSRTLKIIFNIAQIPGVRSSVNIHNASSLGRHPKYEVAVLIVVTILAAILPEGVHLGGIFLEILDLIAVG